MQDESDIYFDTDGYEKLSGCVEGIIYTNEDNGYTVCDLGTDDDDIVTIYGIMPYICEGDRLTVYGEWKHNPKYGRQFSVDQYEKQLPANAMAILRYLSSGAIKGIGKKTAQKIVDMYGDNTLDVLENHPEWLSDIPGLSQKKAKQICEEFKQKAGIRTAMIFFRQYFGASLTIKIYKRWGAASVDVAKKDPWRLCKEIDGIGFEKADALAKNIGADINSASRMSSGIKYVLSNIGMSNGHVCLKRDMLSFEAAKLLSSSAEDVNEAIDDMLSAGELKIYRCDGCEYIFDRISYACEEYIAEKLSYLDRLCPSIDVRDINEFIKKEERLNGFEYAAMQKEAITEALSSGVMILTGGPGTGKTTIVKALLSIFLNMDMKVALCAPTGRAAKRLSESTACEAKTIHRLLEYDFGGDDEKSGFRRDENNQLAEDVVIVDESSMIDNILMSSLLHAIKPGARLILIGDADQLPSVGAGNVLRDIIGSERFSTVRLNEIFRQAKRSLIVTNAHAVNQGQMPILDVKDNDFFFLARKSDREISATVTELCSTRLPRAYGDMGKQAQVISPSRKGEAGTEHLNILLQDALNARGAGKKEYKYREITFREGDRVMQVKNNYELEWWRDDDTTGMGIFNGDIGIIEKIDTASSEISIVYDDKHVVYDTSVLDEIEHAYAVTVHKSQGCEYPIVIIPAYRASPMLLTRNLIYTAITRAQKMVIIVGYSDVIERMVKNDHFSVRYTCLRHRLCGSGGNA